MASLGLSTVNDVLVRIAARGGKEVMRKQEPNGQWVGISGDELYGWVRAVADQYKQWGVKRGDRIILLAENRWEWAVADFAALAIGAVDVPLYSTLGADQIGYMFQDSGAKVAVVSTREQYDKLAGAGELPALEHVLVMDAGSFPNASSFADLKESAAAKRSKDAAFDAENAAAKPEELCTIIYTSGTTGQPKGVELTHDNLASNINLAVPAFGVNDRDVLISYLPLSHVFQRHVDYALLTIGALIAYCPRFDRLPDAMKAIHPTFFVGVPRVFEKIRQTVEHRSTSGSAFKKTIFEWALRVGKVHRDEIVNGKQPSGLASECHRPCPAS